MPFKRSGARPNKPHGFPNGPHNFSKDPKAKAFWVAAFNTMFGDEDEGDENENNTPRADENQANATDDKDNENANEDMCSIHLLVGSLKEKAVGFLVPTSAYSFSKSNSFCQ